MIPREGAVDTRQSAAAGGVTVALPVYNEEALLVANTTRLVEYLAALGVPFQVIIGSNGSTDRTVALGRALPREHSSVEFFHLPRRGVGLAFREFVARARFSVLVSLDMDLSVDLGFLERALRLAQSHDLVIGSKKLAVQRRSRFRKAGSDLFLWCARRLTGLPYDDYSIGAKAYRVAFLRESAASIDAGSSYVLNLCLAAHRRGLPVACVPVDCEDRRASRFNLLYEACYKFRKLFVLWAWSPAPAGAPAVRPELRGPVAVSEPQG
jgi:glycosyltransferase involved in cell wall biosynthesis